MKKYKITDKQRKMLTEFIGECWHEYDCEMEDDGIIRQFCVICDADSSSNHFGFRTFTTDSDMMAVRKALRNKEKMWHNFFNYLGWIDTIPSSFNAGEFWLNRKSMAYLDENPERFCWLVAKFLEERK